ncbi:MAG: adenosylcobinamide-GDP ribazoletransferase [Methanocellales archaeon]|nr:adenosylcobinamide-GDP ribazoletransferase [Methanocellales archaeon]MDD3291493.1 adenosylcobinamide-GDP ribazoletransferase [Methanocellales archaeon]MDD5234617.1 adenosylcobinamide-GDP ribazoletransferase [Methanocellales archaeon]MDD5485030.1 adenosylcobinamide-GDP ribazoletransferase [Methanocellales archaeon]
MNEYIPPIRAGIGFFTTIPVGIDVEGIQKLSSHAYLFPVMGFIIGLLVGCIGFMLQFLSDYLFSALLIAVLYMVTGMNHLDGLMDFGDALLTHGSVEEKIRAMRDPSMGVGGIAFCIVSILILFSAIAELKPNILFSLLAAEICAKQSMVTAALFGRSMHQGLGSIFVDNVTLRDVLIGLAFSMMGCWLALGLVGIIALFAALSSAWIVVRIAHHNLGGVSGDVLGATNEIGRISALIVGGVAWTLL